MKLFVSVNILLKSLIAPPDSTPVVAQAAPCYDMCRDVIGVYDQTSHLTKDYIFDGQMYQYGCDTIQQVKFWRQVMKLDKDTVLFNVGNTRQVLHALTEKEWSCLSEEAKVCYRDSVRLSRGLSDSARILVTAGKSFFYDFNKAYPNFHRGIHDFMENGVDPWYAQAILLIESPNRLQKSNAGAYGSFQLMRDVARMYGLKVNRQVDERADFDRSAYAASSLIKKICIPKTRQMLDSLHIPYREDELWFRLLVMHSYHAGAGNVRKALFSFMPKEGGMGLVYTLWQTETKQFRSASQNYSQLVLAAMIEMNARLALTAPRNKTTSSNKTESGVLVESN